MNTYGLREFYEKVLGSYYEAHATPEMRKRVEEKKLTIKGAFDWMLSKAQKIHADVTENQWAYDEMMHYFTFCNEGDTYKTDKEIKAEEERQKQEAEKRVAKAADRRKDHAERVAKWATLTPEQIAADIKRSRWLKKHSWHKGKSDEELDGLIADDEAMEARRKKETEERKAKEAEKKRIAEEKAKAKAEREAERKRKEEERAKAKAEKEAAKKAAEDSKPKWHTEQLSLF